MSTLLIRAATYHGAPCHWRHVWALAVVLVLSGCVTHSIPESTPPPFGWREWNPAPLTLLDSIEQYPIVYGASSSNKDGAAATGGEPVAFAMPEPGPPPVTRTPLPAVQRERVAIEYIEPGATLKLGASAEGAPPFSYQWQKNGKPIDGANQALLTLEKVNPADSGVYTCIVSNAVGSQAGQPIRVVVKAPRSRAR